MESINAAGVRLLVFDDGDIKEVEDAEIQEKLDAHPTPLIKSAIPAHGGVVEGMGGKLMASRVLREGQKVVGTFIGATGVTLGGETMYQAFIVRQSAFQRPANRPPSRRSPGAPSAQERFGIHTFRRGDAVEYTRGEDTSPDERCPSPYIPLHTAGAHSPYILLHTTGARRRRRSSVSLKGEPAKAQRRPWCCSVARRGRSSSVGGQGGGVCPNQAGAASSTWTTTSAPAH